MELPRLLLWLCNIQVVRAKVLGGGQRPSTSRGGGGGSGGGSSSGCGGGAGGGGGPGEGSAMAFAVGLLDIAIPREDRIGGTFPRVMINDACIARAVQGECVLRPYVGRLSVSLDVQYAARRQVHSGSTMSTVVT